jgi:hypothetical protein
MTYGIFRVAMVSGSREIWLQVYHMVHFFARIDDRHFAGCHESPDMSFIGYYLRKFCSPKTGDRH